MTWWRWAGLIDLTERIKGWDKFKLYADKVWTGVHRQRQALRPALLHLCRLDVLPQGLVRRGGDQRAAQNRSSSSPTSPRSSPTRRKNRYGFGLRGGSRRTKPRHRRVHAHSGTRSWRTASRRWTAQKTDRGARFLFRPLHETEGLPRRARRTTAIGRSWRASRPARRR